jgi:hypothetical protein
MKSSRTVKTLGLAAALLVPAIAIAAFQVPHTYNAGDVLKADDLKVNFGAVSSEIDSLRSRLATVEALQARVAAVESSAAALSTTTSALSTTTSTLTATTNTLSSISLRSCRRVWAACAATPGAECAVKCPMGWAALSGGCDAQAGSAISQSAPRLADGVSPYPGPDDILPAKFDGWICQAEKNPTTPQGEGVMQSVHAFCCPP